MINMRFALLVGWLTCFAAISGYAQLPGVGEKPKSAEKVSKLGDVAPPVTVMEWIKGQPVDFKTGTNFYVLVFCSLSRANDFALTNLTLLQKRYRDKGLITVAISDDAPEALKELVQSKGAGIDFNVAADIAPGRTRDNYQRAFKQFKLPLAFIVSKDGKVLWHGHPLNNGMGYVVEDIVNDRYNLELAQKKVIATEQMEGYLALVRTGDPKGARVGQVLLTARTNDAGALCELASKIATDPYIPNRDVALATSALDRAAPISTTNTTDIALNRAILLFQTGKREEALASAKTTLAAAKTPGEKEVGQICVQAMDSALSAAKTNQTPGPAGKP
jgi:hypothetical protein